MQYIVYDNEFEFDMNTLVYQQSPECNYPYTAVYTWESGTNNYVVSDPVFTEILHVSSLLPASASTSNMAVSAAVTIADNNGYANQEFYPSGAVAFNVDIVNPCLTGNSIAISPLGFSPANPTVVDGTTSFTQWFQPTTSVDVTHDSVGGMCGPISYQIFGSTSDTPVSSTGSYSAEWAIISEPVDGTYRLTFDTTLD